VLTWEVKMKALHCGDVMKGCDFVARGATEDEVMKQTAEHAKSAHGMHHITPELAMQVRQAIRDEQPAT
jgi:predicted small metal-binding protein